MRIFILTVGTCRGVQLYAAFERTAKHLGERIRGEEGPGTAVKLLEPYLTNQPWVTPPV